MNKLSFLFGITMLFVLTNFQGCVENISDIKVSGSFGDIPIYGLNEDISISDFTWLTKT